MLLTIAFCLNSKQCWKIALYHQEQLRLICNVSRSHLCFSSQEQRIPSEPLLTIYKVRLELIFYSYPTSTQKAEELSTVANTGFR